MTNEVKILERKESIYNNISPDGRQWRVLKWGETAMYEITQVRTDEFDREVPDRRAYVPDQFKQAFTSLSRAQAQLNRFLIAMWDQSDEVRARTERKQGKRDAA